MTQIEHRDIDIGGIKTHYLEGGSGSTVVLIHSGEFGGSGTLTWEFMLPALAEHHHVIAPDWLGYGGTDKLYDFAGGGARRLRHMGEFLEAVGVEDAAFMGSSMGGSVLAEMIARESPPWPISAAILVSGGGFAPDNADRQKLLKFDASEAAVREMLEVLLYDPSKLLADDAYIARRVEQANVPGAWEAVAAARFKSPQVPPRSDFGKPDETRYEEIAVPVLIIAGAEDRLREPGYAQELADRIPDCVAHIYEHCGHMPSLEMPDRAARDVIDFLAGLEGREPALTASSKED